MKLFHNLNADKVILFLVIITISIPVATISADDGDVHLPAIPVYYLLAPVIIAVIMAVVAAAKRGNPEPVLLEVKVPTRINLGETFEIAIKAANKGKTAKRQTVYIEFPDLSSIRDLTVASSDLQTRRVGIGDKLRGKHGMTVYAACPVVEALEAPWHKGDKHSIIIHVRPPIARNFTVFVKATAFEDDKYVHYPREGIKDHLNEFVKAYTILVKKIPEQKEDMIVLKAEAKIVGQKTTQPQMVPAYTTPSKPSWLEHLKTEYDSLLAQLAETRQEITATRQKVESRQAKSRR
ncbi:MAG: hypothetical protein ACREA3_04365 [Nitrosotalea sp.]